MFHFPGSVPKRNQNLLPNHKNQIWDYPEKKGEEKLERGIRERKVRKSAEKCKVRSYVKHGARRGLTSCGRARATTESHDAREAQAAVPRQWKRKCHFLNSEQIAPPLEIGSGSAEIVVSKNWSASAHEPCRQTSAISCAQ